VPKWQKNHPRGEVTRLPSLCVLKILRIANIKIKIAKETKVQFEKRVPPAKNNYYLAFIWLNIYSKRRIHKGKA